MCRNISLIALVLHCNSFGLGDIWKSHATYSTLSTNNKYDYNQLKLYHIRFPAPGMSHVKYRERIVTSRCHGVASANRGPANMTGKERKH